MERSESLSSSRLPARAVNACETLLKSKGWATAAMACIQNGEAIYIVTGTYGEDRILAKAKTQSEAWADAVQQVTALAGAIPAPLAATLCNSE